MVGIRLFPFGAWPMFRCYVGLRECTWHGGCWKNQEIKVVVVSEGHLGMCRCQKTLDSTLDDPRNTCKCVLTEWFKKHPFVPDKWVKNPIKTLNPWDTQSHHYSVGNLTPCDSWISSCALNASLQLQVSSATAFTISRWWKVEMPRNRRHQQKSVWNMLKFGIKHKRDVFETPSNGATQS